MEWLWLAPALPLFGAVILAICGGLLPRREAAVIGCASVGLSWLTSVFVAVNFLRHHQGAYQQTLFQWIEIGSFQADMGLYLDQLSLVMVVTVTFVGFLIHLYSVEHMRGEADYSLFFCYLNLFVGSMLVLVLGSNLLSLYLGWEGVGLCSYLLIGFQHRERSNGLAAQKAFIVTRIGDTSLAIGLFLLVWWTGTLDIQQAAQVMGDPRLHAVAAAVGLFLLGGAVGKSAQIPLHTWLPYAMAGPTPVSALIHAATMVTAGVYLIARTGAIYRAAPEVMLVVALVGAVTLVYAACCALAQRDIKRVLAYSTISQIGYMFLALGVGAWSGAIFHFVTHAFLKALLFLSAGVVVQALGEERDIHRMGGLWRKLPWAGWSFLMGACSLAALPLVTAGFYSKDQIIWASWASAQGSWALGLAGLVGSFLTALYIFRVFFLVFFGEQKREAERESGFLVKLPVAALSFFSLVAGFVGVPRLLGGSDLVERFLSAAVGSATPTGAGGEGAFLLLSAIETLAGIGLCFWIYRRAPAWAASAAESRWFDVTRRFLLAGGGFDWLYDRVFVRPYVFATRVNRADAVDTVYTGIAFAAWLSNRMLSATESGRVRNYATGLLLGAVLVTVILLFR